MPKATESDANEAILPCPFCGGVAEYDNNKTSHYGFDVPGVECRNDGCGYVRNFAGSKEEAIKMWNRRAGNEQDS